MDAVTGGYSVYLVDPGQDRAGLLVLIQEVNGLSPEAASDYLLRFPSRIATFETEAAARNLADRFRDFDAVAVVRPAGLPPAPAPVEDVAAPPVGIIQAALLVLGVAQLGVAWLWFGEGRWVAALFGALLALYVLLYFGLPLVRRR